MNLKKMNLEALSEKNLFNKFIKIAVYIYLKA